MKRTRRSNRNNRRMNRRSFLKTSGLSLAALSALGIPARRAMAATASPNAANRLLFVFTATGGGSMVDSFMAVRESEPSSQSVADQLLVYPDAFVKSFPGTDIRALDTDPNYRNFLGATGIPYAQSTFVGKYHQNMAVMALENTSVNHFVAQERSLNGQGINGGRTIAEHIAEVYGQDLALPLVNMAGGGFVSGGTDPTLPAYARAENIGAPSFFSLGTDGMRGMVGAPGSTQPGTPPSAGAELERGKKLMARAREIRNQLDDASTFYQTFQCSPLLSDYRVQRELKAMELEELDLFSKLFMFGSGDLAVDFDAYGLLENPEAIAAREIITAWPGDPNRKMDILVDQQVGQVLLAYLMAKEGLTAASVFGPNLSTQIGVIDQQPPLVFDYSHNNHVAAQATMWSRILDLVDKLIQLLQSTGTVGGGTLWDRSLIYIATDFGRDKVRTTPGAPLYTVDPDGDGPLQAGVVNTGHHLNNGCVVISPLVKPGLYGGVNPDTLHTYGFNRETGMATDTETIRIGDIYSVIADALDAPFTGMIPIPALMP